MLDRKGANDIEPTVKGKKWGGFSLLPTCGRLHFVQSAWEAAKNRSQSALCHQDAALATSSGGSEWLAVTV